MKKLAWMWWVVLAAALAGCAGPRPPPGWPAGEPRPINGAGPVRDGERVR